MWLSVRIFDREIMQMVSPLKTTPNTTKNMIRVTPVQPGSDDAFERYLLPLDSKSFKFPCSSVVCLMLRLFDDTPTCSRLQRLALSVVKLTKQTRRVSGMCRLDDS